MDDLSKAFVAIILMMGAGFILAIGVGIIYTLILLTIEQIGRFIQWLCNK